MTSVIADKAKVVDRLYSGMQQILNSVRMNAPLQNIVREIEDVQRDVAPAMQNSLLPANCSI